MASDVRLSAAGAQTYADAPAEGPPSGLTGASLKLVIWDLDDTLWRGTLSEEEVELDDERAEIVRELNRRGIVSSICSKNDLATARERLERLGLWDEFVFASISWSPKGVRIAQIIDDMQLRAPNVLFVDDNAGNLREALHYVPELQTAGVEQLGELLALPQSQGKDDRSLTRLQQYRLLERKVSDRELATVSNEEFLRSCEIAVELRAPTGADVERLLELVNRSNQLNFTKSRLTEAELHAMLDDPARETRYVQVRDRYGDYGVCGFYSLLDGRLEDFVFSCRILHMGVEQWLYERLGKPRITVLGEVASALETGDPVDWIALRDAADAADASDGATAREAKQPSPPERFATSSSRVLLKGGCDLFLLNGFLGGSIKTEFTYLSSTGAEVHSDHTEIIRRSTKQTIAEFGSIIDRLPFLDRAAYGSRIVRRPKSFGTLIFSVLMDYTQGLYRLGDSNFVVPYGQHDEDATDPARWSSLEGRWGNDGVDRPFLEWFAEHFQYEGALSATRLEENIRWLAETLPQSSRLVLINGAEVSLDSDAEPARHLHHQTMNLALERVAAELPNVAICDVRPIVVTPEDLKDNIRHYTRQTYLQMAKRLEEIVGDDLRIEQRPLLMRVHRAQRKLERTLGRAAVRLTLR
jgi:FkbH-like protein